MARTWGKPPSPALSTDVAITFGVLGPLEVREGGRLLDLRGPQERALLALLLTAPGRVLSVSAIVAGMWGDVPPGGAERTVQAYVSRLRRALPGDGASLVVTRTPGYLAEVDPARVDAERFRTLTDAGRRDLGAGRPEVAAATLRDALGLWRGEAYAEFEAPFASAERTRLEELRLAALEDRLAADLATGAGAELVGELEGLLARHPWRERLWGQLMTALYRSGRQGDALTAFQRARARLVDELGIEPGPDLRAVEAMVLAQDTRLLAVDRSHRPLPPELTVVGPTFVGRQAELSRLLAAYDRAAAGSVERVLLTGSHGMGKTRLLAELARLVGARGGLVRYGLREATLPQSDEAILAVLDDLQRASPADLAILSESLLSARPPLLVAGACVWGTLAVGQEAAVTTLFRERLSLPPLQAADIDQVVRLYVPAEAVADAVEAVAEAGGVPLQVHAAASRYGEGFAAAQVEEAVAGISGPRHHLASSREHVADGVVELQRIRLVREAHAPRESPRVICPYKGLAFFDVDDAPYFFGRERLVAQLVARLVDAPLLAVVGPSGSGKSSAVRAGLVAAVAAGVLPGSDHWRIVLTTPTQPPPDVSTGARTLLVVDQFEELFTTMAQSRQGDYAGWLAEAAGENHVTVVVAVRSDYYGHATIHPRLADLLAANTVLVGEMTPDELKQAVELPAGAAGLELEPGLAETIAGDVAGEPGGLPLVSTALLSLWERREGRRLSLAAYHEIGGVRTAVARLAETAFGQLTPSQRSVARRTLLRLAETGEGGEPVRRRVPIAEVSPDGDADARAVLDTLAARRLLTVSETHAEVAHEALLREWPRLRGWLDEDEAGRQLRRHLVPAALAWQESNDAGELYRGARLSGALDWQRDHPKDLTEVEHDFLRTSQEVAEAEALRRRRSIRRLRGLAVGLAGVLVIALIAGFFAMDQRNEAKAASLSADVRALRAGALKETRWDRALLFAAQAQRFEASADSRAALLQTVQRSPEATAILNAEQPLQTVATSADGTTVAAGGTEGSVYVWDTVSGRRTHTIDRVTWLSATSLDISPDGRYLGVVGIPQFFVDEGTPWKNQVMIIDLEETPPSPDILESDPLSAARFAADERTIVALGTDGQVRYLDVATGVVQRTLDFAVVVSETVVLDGPDDRRFMAAADPAAPGLVSAWEVDTGHPVWSSTEPDGTVASISPNGSTMVIGHAGGEIEEVDLAAGGVRTPVPSSLVDGLVDVTWSPDGLTFAGATQERTVLVWNAETAEAEAVLRGHSGTVTQVVYSADGATLYAPGLDRSVVAWDRTGDKGIVKEVGDKPGAGVERTALAGDGSVAATRYSDGRVNVSNFASGQSFDVPVPGQADWMSVDESGRYVLVFLHSRSPRGGSWTRVTVSIIDVATRALLPHKIEVDGVGAYDAVVTVDGRWLLTAGERRVDLWELATGGQRSALFFYAADPVPALQVHPNGRLAALSEDGGAIEVVDLATAELVTTLDPGDAAGGAGLLSPLAFSPDGRWLAAGSSSGRVLLWDTRSWQVAKAWDAVQGHGVDSLVFTPDSRFLVSGGAGAASIWSVEKGGSGGGTLDVDPLRAGATVWVGTSDGGRTVVTFTEGTGVREWSIAPERLLKHACAVAGRNLTRPEWEDALPGRPYVRTCPEYPVG